MNRLFGRRQEPRRSSDDDYNKMQYFTPRGEIPAKVAEKQVRDVVIDPNNIKRNRYPHEYMNEEGPNDDDKHAIFAPFEKRNRPVAEVGLYEVPLNSRMNLDKKSMPVLPPHFNDRARVERKEPNTPGAFRGVATVDKHTGRNYGISGVMYHPEGDINGFERAPMEPLSREGRQFLRRFADDEGDHRVTTWPPRDEDANDLASYEERFKLERKTKNKPMPQSHNKFLKK
ncbi:hypothetical protein FPOA_00236 [Fusarium poae]|uniref:Uncharacterized protein n=1 Tax=Fusarium poae TaxID=36050 RepID=A0A1B8B0U0_FUSPO|nr:hypothetical protein FPOA_00236 [Fusarium poae]